MMHADQQELVSFQAVDAGYDVSLDARWDATRTSDQPTDDSLKAFFKRPIEIFTATSTINTESYFNFNPWDLFLNDTRVLNRLAHFNKLQCKLHLRFLINGSPFHYGRFLVSYLPFATSTGLPASRALFPLDIIAESQRLCIHLNPTTSKGGDMILPFFYPRDTFNIPTRDWTFAGEVTIRSFNPLRHSNGANINVVITVLAWAEDVHLSVPTENLPSGLVPQSGDEYGMGIISKPATAVAHAAKALARIPFLSNYAMATSVAASTLAKVASVFGYSKPISVMGVTPVKPTFVGNVPNTNMEDTSIKLSLDAKQELTIDGSIAGVDSQDPLAFSNIVTRESFITSFAWTGARQNNYCLFNMNVTPFINDFAAPEYYCTPSFMVASTFANWRGSMKYRFQVVCAANHKGRLRIAWDPVATRFVSGNTITGSFNTVYSHILDIGECQDFTVCVHWGTTYGFLLTSGGSSTLLVDTGGNRLFNSGTALTSLPLQCNGQISVSVMNPLVGPTATGLDVSVNVFTSMCDDFQFAEPDCQACTDLHVFPLLTAQSGYEKQAGDAMADTPEESAPSQMGEVAEFSQLRDDSNLMKVYFGEVIGSFRNYFKRYVFAAAIVTPNNTLPFIYSRRSWNLWGYSGYDPNGIHVANNARPINFTSHKPFMHILPCFTGWRGAIRLKYIPFGTRGYSVNGENFDGISWVRRNAVISTIGTAINPFINITDSGMNRYKNSYLNLLSAGGTVNSIGHNPVMEVDLPYYSNERFALTRLVGGNSPTSLLRGQYHTFGKEFYIAGGNRLHGQNVLFSVGEDFTTFYWQGPPVFYKYNLELQ